MKTNQEPIILAERAADYGRLRSVLLGWGYEEHEIQRVLTEQRVSRKLGKTESGAVNSPGCAGDLIESWLADFCSAMQVSWRVGRAATQDDFKRAS